MIHFRCIRWKNFLSTGNTFTEIHLDDKPNCLIVGHNGAGKSTILDALTYSLFGKPFRKINKPQLMNTTNSRDLLTEIEFKIGNREYKVVRGIRPNVFEIYVNGELLNQQAATKDQQEYLEKSILKLNYKTFTQIVILGSSSFVPFMQLPAGHRREVIEDLLDIEIFSRMNSVLKQRTTELKDSIRDNEYNIGLAEEKVKLQKEYIKTLKSDNEKKIKEYEKSIADAENDIEDLQAKIEDCNKSIKFLKPDETKLNTLISKVSKAEEIETDLNSKIKTAQKERKFYQENDNCPTCKQSIDEQFKNEVIDESKTKISELTDAIKDLHEQIDGMKTHINELSGVEAQIHSLNEEISGYNVEVRSKNHFIGQVQSQIQSLHTGDDSGVTQEQKKLEDLVAQGTSLMKVKSELSTQREVMNIASLMLKDTGIKTKIIKQYVPIINKLVNKYLASMDFYINFELDESFNESINSRYRNEFSYASFSEGEKMRIDLALLFTWRAIARLKNSVSTNLLILDEVFDSSLDGNGTEDFMKILRTLGEDTNVFVISHKGDILQDRFNDIIRFEKKGNFSKVMI